MNFSNNLKALFALPPTNQRKIPQFLKSFFGVNFDLGVNANYLFFRCAKITFIVASIIAFIIFLTSYVINKTGTPLLLFNISPLYVFSKIVFLPAYFLAFFFYLRSRLPIDLKNTPISWCVRKDFLFKKPKSTWILGALMLLFTSFFLICLGHIVFIKLIIKYQAEQSSLALFFALFLQVITTSYSTSLLVNGLLMLEKTIRFFPQAQNGLVESNEAI